MMTNMFRGLWRALVSGVLTLAVTAPVMASADGLPRLDPSNGTTGTDYIFVLPVAGRTMDPGAASFVRTFRGSFTLFQDVAASDFNVDNMTLDTDSDGQPDRTLTCDGRVGRGRFAMSCSEDDGGAEIRLVINGKAVTLLGGRHALRKASGHGFTESHTLFVLFQAIEQ